MWGCVHSYGGREASLEGRAKKEMAAAEVEGKDLLSQAKVTVGSVEEKGKVLAAEAKAKAVELKDRVVR